MADGEAVIRDIWRRWNEGLREYDPEVVDPEIEVHSMLTGHVFQGEEGLLRWAREVDDQFEAWELGIDSIEALSDEQFVVRGLVRARGRQSGLDLKQQMTWKVELRESRLLRLENIIGWDSE